MKIIGLTGGIGTGKSTASNILRSLGITVIDADQISRSLLADHSPYVEKLATELGEWFLDKDRKVDRKVLGKKVFGSPEVRKQLEEFLHPLIRKEMEFAIEKAKGSGERIVVLDIPLLFENGYWKNHVNEIWLIDSTKELQKERIQKRDHLKEDEIDARIATQMTLEEKRKRSDHVISNIGTREELEIQLRKLVAAQQV